MFAHGCLKKSVYFREILSRACREIRVPILGEYKFARVQLFAELVAVRFAPIASVELYFLKRWCAIVGQIPKTAREDET